MRPCDNPRETPDWMPQAAACPTCGNRTWGHECDDLTMPDCVLGEN